MSSPISFIVTPSLNMTFNNFAADGRAGCYAYALNNAAVEFNSLGGLKDSLRISTHNARNFTEPRVLRELARQDGLMPIESPFNPAEKHIIALFGALAERANDTEVGGHHFFRLDGDGTWSEKQGPGKACNTDLQGHPLKTRGALHTYFRERMSREESAQNGKLLATVFAGYFEVPREGVIVVPKPASFSWGT